MNLPRVVIYKEDGSGRDTYILYNNGGWGSPRRFPPQSPPSFSPLPRTLPPILSKTVKYTPNGSGRDSYVFKEGRVKRVFVEGLRDYQRGSRSNSPRTVMLRELFKRREQNQAVEALSKPKTWKIEGKTGGK